MVSLWIYLDIFVAGEKTALFPCDSSYFAIIMKLVKQ